MPDPNDASTQPTSTGTAGSEVLSALTSPSAILMTTNTTLSPHVQDDTDTTDATDKSCMSSLDF